jgi:hypothetical protein
MLIQYSTSPSRINGSGISFMVIIPQIIKIDLETRTQMGVYGLMLIQQQRD